MAKHNRGTGDQNLGFLLAGVAFWVFIVLGAPALVHVLYEAVSPWMPR